MHHSFQETSHAKTALSGKATLAPFSKRPTSSHCSGIEAHQGHALKPPLCGLELSSQSFCSNGAVESLTDPMEMPFLSEIEQGGSNILRTMWSTLGRSTRWLLQACSTTRSSAARSTRSHLYAHWQEETPWAQRSWHDSRGPSQSPRSSQRSNAIEARARARSTRARASRDRSGSNSRLHLCRQPLGAAPNRRACRPLRHRRHHRPNNSFESWLLP